MIDFALPEAPLDVDAALALLRRTLRRNAGHFAFVVVVVDEHTRGEVMRRLREWSGADGVPTLTEFPTGADGAGKLDLLLRGGLPRHGGIVVPDGDALVVADEGRLAAGLNLARDQLRKWVAGPFVVLLSSPALAALARAVPDLYDVRHMVEVRNQDAVVPTFGALQANDRESMFTLRDLENNLACFCGAPEDDPRSLVELMLFIARQAHQLAYRDPRRISQEALQLGVQAADRAEHLACRHGLAELELDARCSREMLRASEQTPEQHLDALEEIRHHYDLQGRPVVAAHVRGLSAQYLAFRGELDEAIGVLITDVVPVFLQHRDISRLEHVVQHAALELAKSGRHRDGARLLREVGALALNQFEEHERALRYLTAAASMLRHGGFLDEAVRILNEEVLPSARTRKAPQTLFFAEYVLAETYLDRGRSNDLGIALLHAEAAESEAHRVGLRDMERNARALANDIESHRAPPPAHHPNRAARRAARRQQARRTG